MPLKYERKYFIKDLFNAKEVFRNFDLVKFESLKAFITLLDWEFFKLEEQDEILIYIHSASDYKNLMRILIETNASKLVKFYLEIEDEELWNEISEVLEPERYDIIIPIEFESNVGKIWSTDGGKEWLRANRLIMKKTLRGNEFRDDCYEIIYKYCNDFVRFFLINIDYYSFDDVKIKDLPLIRHWCYKLKEYQIVDNRTYEQPLVILTKNNFFKSCFVSNEYVVFLNENKNKVWFIDLIEYMDKNGEEIPFEKLNRWRTYLDLHPNAMYQDFRIFNWYLVDFEQNLIKMGHINEIPEIIGMLSWWLH